MVLGTHPLWWKILHSLGETILEKCDLSEDMDSGDVMFYNRLHLPPPQHQLMRNICRYPFQKIDRVGRWFPPPQSILKINTDRSSWGNPGPIGIGGIGGIGRNSLGIVLFLFSIYKGCHTNNLMESLAILFIVECACSLGWSRIICESDSQEVVNLLTQQHFANGSWQLSSVVN